jgi:ribosome-binding ATPase YchF (GTP1/OBG family)
MSELTINIVVKDSVKAIRLLNTENMLKDINQLAQRFHSYQKHHKTEKKELIKMLEELESINLKYNYNE